MSARMDPGLLWARAIIAGVLFFTLGVAGHVSADGLLPGTTVLVFLAVAAILGAALVLRAPASQLRVVLVLVLGQSGVHAALTGLAGHRGDPAPVSAAAPRHLPLPVATSGGDRPGSLYEAYQQSIGAGTDATPLHLSLPIGSITHLATDIGAHSSMMLVHLVAAVVVGLWLAHGEAALWTFLALSGARIRIAGWALAPTPAPRNPALHLLPATTPLYRESLWRSRPATRRGPPLAA